MILTEETLRAWLEELDARMYGGYQIENYSKTMTDEEWLNEYAGELTDAAIEDWEDEDEGE